MGVHGEGGRIDNSERERHDPPCRRLAQDWDPTVIDGRRRGVRESLDGQTLGMAHATAALIGSTPRYPDGNPVQCVVPEERLVAWSKPLAVPTCSGARASVSRLPSRPRCVQHLIPLHLYALSPRDG